jgi:hypothetical protein
VESRDNRLALGADDVCGILLVLIVGFEHVEDQRLDVVAGGATIRAENEKGFAGITQGSGSLFRATAIAALAFIACAGLK